MTKRDLVEDIFQQVKRLGKQAFAFFGFRLLLFLVRVTMRRRVFLRFRRSLFFSRHMLEVMQGGTACRTRQLMFGLAFQHQRGTGFAVTTGRNFRLQVISPLNALNLHIGPLPQHSRR